MKVFVVIEHGDDFTDVISVHRDLPSAREVAEDIAQFANMIEHEDLIWTSEYYDGFIKIEEKILL